jgi:uncharacterized protein (TIGR02145 family)
MGGGLSATMLGNYKLMVVILKCKYSNSLFLSRFNKVFSIFRLFGSFEVNNKLSNLLLEASMKNLLTISICWFFIVGISLSQTVYYVNSTDGSDLNAGLSPSSPRKTISSLTNTSFLQDGDVINIAAGHYTQEGPIIKIHKNIIINGYRFLNFTDVVIDLSSTKMEFSMSGQSSFTLYEIINGSIAADRFIFLGSSTSGINLISGSILLENAKFIIQPPFLFQSNIPGSSNPPTTTWFADITIGNRTFNGLSSSSTGQTIGPLPYIFHIYSKNNPQPSNSDVINIASGNYKDAPVIQKNFLINGYDNNSSTNDVSFDLRNKDLHFIMTGRAIFRRNNVGTFPGADKFYFYGSDRTGFVFASGCIELTNSPFEIDPPFLIKKNPSYCVGTPTIPYVVYENQVYHTIPIGNKCWLQENLNVGDKIYGNTEQMNNSLIEKYCFADSELNCEKYGGLYQWAEALQYKNNATNTSHPSVPFSGYVRGICPEKWHIPEYHFSEMGGSLGNSNDGNKLKAIGEGTPPGAGTNTTGFSALLSGWRNSTGSSALFTQQNIWTFFLTTYLAPNPSNTYGRHVNYNTSNFWMSDGAKKNGISVRCLHDSWTGIPTDINENIIYTEIKDHFTLMQNFPNPFNPSTTIMYSIPYSQFVTLKIYDILGKEITTLVNEEKQRGNYQVEFNGSKLSSGIYFYKLLFGNSVINKKMLLLK